VRVVPETVWRIAVTRKTLHNNHHFLWRRCYNNRRSGDGAFSFGGEFPFSNFDACDSTDSTSAWINV